ncbi:TetR/AcrR family transcriptional regulator [Nocardioides daeguensis]|uniref:TetR/AcrR family transcriptional regulator n=1 Tax=Nocardioides daeguensis TaxID=908359 RepID=A0ABP6VDC6_9ACTN|nr:TetR/AcrR family transcriptional regulator [Nocardioides daeguensis]MBV6729527.1 TetR/AcrR family transcriptional regulator [Nocardioides daeguensis]MCR1771700.1 TetR/AcrR family transcriptional regulator [Nocardioides daeguensis]
MRKAPQQARSREMVERLVTAGRRVLVERGYDAFSTNRVATVAGVSPGSLYQYFPDKAAILEVVIDRYWEEVADRVAASLADRIGEFGPGMVRATTDALLTALEADRELLRVVAEELPVQRNRERRAALERRVRELMTTYLAARPDSSHRPNPAVASWVVVLAIENLAMRWVLDQPEVVTRDQLLDEVLALVGGYLLA